MRVLILRFWRGCPVTIWLLFRWLWHTGCFVYPITVSEPVTFPLCSVKAYGCAGSYELNDLVIFIFSDVLGFILGNCPAGWWRNWCCWVFDQYCLRKRQGRVFIYCCLVRAFRLWTNFRFCISYVYFFSYIFTFPSFPLYSEYFVSYLWSHF